MSIGILGFISVGGTTLNAGGCISWAVAGLLAGDPVNFASNTLVIVTAPGNPKKVGSLADLVEPGLSVVVCAPQVPCGSATTKVLGPWGRHRSDSSHSHRPPQAVPEVVDARRQPHCGTR